MNQGTQSVHEDSFEFYDNNSLQASSVTAGIGVFSGNNRPQNAGIAAKIATGSSP
jgi:hypothetical protein